MQFWGFTQSQYFSHVAKTTIKGVKMKNIFDLTEKLRL